MVFTYVNKRIKKILTERGTFFIQIFVEFIMRTTYLDIAPVDAKIH